MIHFSLPSSNQQSGKECGTYDPDTSIKYYYRNSEIEDCHSLAPRMCRQDAYEVLTATGSSPLEALLMSFEISYDCRSIIKNGEVMGMFGCSKMDDISGIPWLLSNGDFKGFRKKFLKEGKMWVESVQSQHKILFNYVHDQNSGAIKWLKFLGFKICREIPNYGFGKHDTFYEFFRV